MRVFLNQGRVRPSFSDVLDDVSREAGADLGSGMRYERRRTVRPSRLEHLGEIARELRMSMFSTLLDSYLENQNGLKASRRLRSTDPQDIAGELSISERMTVGELNRLRRRFALANHPDRVETGERENATHRMMVANMLIDRAVKRRMVR